MTMRSMARQEHSHAELPKWGMKNMPSRSRAWRDRGLGSRHADKKDAEHDHAVVPMAMRTMQDDNKKMITQATITPHTIMRAMTTAHHESMTKCPSHEHCLRSSAR